MNKPILFLILVLLTFKEGSTMHANDATEARVEQLLSQMTLKEKIDYIGGYKSFQIRAINRLQIPEITMADGPVGVRNYGPSTTYPAGINIAASWNTPLALELGQMIGLDARARGVHILLAPGVNLVRAPMCGRNFEYLGEDPHLTSRMAVNLIKGIQSQNVVACVKHFAANNQEWNRHHVSSDIDERTLRELYLPAFEAAVKEANVGCVMASYNLVNGTHMSQNKKLNVDILKNEWGFKGILMSDWKSTYDGIEAANNGLDLEMPSAALMSRETLFAAIQNDKVDVATIDDKVRRILRVLVSFGFLDSPQATPKDSLFNHKGHITSRKMAEESMVLLKNDGILPLEASSIQSIAVIGPCAIKRVPHGSGSSEAKPHLQQSYLSAISDFLDEAANLQYASGVPSFSHPTLTTAPESNEVGLLGEYFDNTTLSGAPALTRIDPAINFRWKERSYKSAGPVNHYSARWTGYFTAEKSGPHTFYLSGHDGFRLTIDDTTLIDRWHKAPSSFEHATITLVEGAIHKLCVEYFVEHGSQGLQLGMAFGHNTAIEQAKDVAAAAEVAIVFAGFDAEHEGEDWDRSFYLPYNQNELIQAVISANPNTLVVMSAGGNVDMSQWLDSTKGLLYAWYPGQEGAKALANVIFGKVCPSGKLPVSFEKKLEDNATYNSYYDKDNSKRVAYSEGIFLGYRHHDSHDIAPLFPFGFGLSYTTFGYSNLTVEQEHPVTVSFDITNTGTQAAKEIAQVYVSDTHSNVTRPKKELKGFCKVALEPHETKRVIVQLDSRAFSYYDVKEKQWKVEPGRFEILVGSSSNEIHLKKSCHIK